MDQPTLETTTHVVAHLLREIESAIRAVLEPIAAASEDADSENSHEAKIRHPGGPHRPARSRVRYCTASLTCCASIRAESARSAMVRAIFKTRW